MEPAVLLAELQASADDVPDFRSYDPASRPHLEWLGKTHALITQWNPLAAISFAHSADMLSVGATRDMSVAAVVGMLHRAIAAVRLQVPSHSDQVFGPGAVYDFYRALRDLLASAKSSVFVVDPYLDDGVFDTYLASIAQAVTVRLLAREHSKALRSRGGEVCRSDTDVGRRTFVQGVARPRCLSGWPILLGSWPVDKRRSEMESNVPSAALA